MRRKSERNKKSKSSPEKVEKSKRNRTTRRRKASSSSENESADESSPHVSEVAPEVVDPVPSADSQTEILDEKVWQVKSDDSASGTGEIKKLKICLSTRLPLTPEPEATPRSRKKLNRTMSETPTDGKEGEEKRRNRHKSRRSMRESRDSTAQETTEDDEDKTSKWKCVQDQDNTIQETKEEESDPAEKPESTVSQDSPPAESEPRVAAASPKIVDSEADTKNTESQDSTCKVDTTEEKRRRVAPLTPIAKRRRSRRLSGSSPEREQSPEPSEPVKLPLISEEPESCPSEQIKIPQTMDSPGKGTEDKKVDNLEITYKLEEQCQKEETSNSLEPTRKSEESKPERTEKPEEGELESTEKPEESEFKSSEKPEDSEHESSEKPEENEVVSSDKPEESKSPESSEQLKLEPVAVHAFLKEPQPDTAQTSQLEENASQDERQSNNERQDDSKSASRKPREPPTPQSESDEVFETQQSRRSKYSHEKESIHTSVSKDMANHSKEEKDSNEEIAKIAEEPVETYNSTPIVVSRKRRWGSRVSKGNQAPPVSISTDILKDIIPDVKPAELEEAIEDKKQRRKSESIDRPRVERPVLPKIVIDNTENANQNRRHKEKEEKERTNANQHRRDKEKDEKEKKNETPLLEHRKISIVKENNAVVRPPSPARNKSSSVLYITNLVRPFTLAQLKNLLQRTGKIVADGFWIDRIKSKCFVTYENEDQAVETRHALHGVTWPVSNPKTLQVDFSSEEHLARVRATEEDNKDKASAIPGTVEDWLREQDAKKERFGEPDESKPWDKKTIVREWDVGKGEKDKEREKLKKEERHRDPLDKRRRRSSERSPEPVRKFKKKEEEAPAKMLDDLFRKTKTVPCIYWLPLSAETIAVKEEQRRQHMAEHERRMKELEHTRTHRRH